MANFNNTQDDNIIGTNKELLYVNHILSTLKDAQSSFNPDSNGKMNISRFLLYCAYLESAILDDMAREVIEKERAQERERLRKEGNMDETTIRFHEGFVTIKYVMRYLNEVMELEHKDIVGVVSRDNDMTEYNLFEEDVNE